MMSSVVWKFFQKINKENVSCNICGKTYKTSGNTTNLAAHLKYKHHHAFMRLHPRNAGSSGGNIAGTASEPRNKIIRSSSTVTSTNSTITTTEPVEIENNCNELSKSAINETV